MIDTVSDTFAQGLQGVTTPAIDTTGANLIIYSVAWYSGSLATLAFSDSASNTGWALWSSPTGSDFQQLVYVKFNPTTSATHTFTNGPTTVTNIYQTLTVLAVSGIGDSGTPEYSSNVVAGSSVTSLQNVSHTPSENNCLALTVAMLRNFGSTGFACDYGATQNIHDPAADPTFAGGMAWTVQTTAAAYNPTWSWATAGDAAMSNLVFKAAAVAGNRFLLH